jgi:hypothetical protein
MKVPKQSTMSVHDVAGKSVVSYPHHEGAEFIAKHLHEEICGALLYKHHECGMLSLNVLSNLLSTFMMEAAISKGFGIKRLQTSKACRK